MSDSGRSRSGGECPLARRQSCPGVEFGCALAGIGYGCGACGGPTVRGGVASRRDRALSVSLSAARPPRSSPSAGSTGGLAESMPVGAAVFEHRRRGQPVRRLARVRDRAGRLVGVDPSPRIHENLQVDERYEQTLEQFAIGHANEFDLAFSVFVLEHVGDADGFATACARVLKPGGTLMGLTVNAWHYFGFITWATTRLGVADWLLARFGSDADIEDYHYPTEYRLNSIQSLVARVVASGLHIGRVPDVGPAPAVHALPALARGRSRIDVAERRVSARPAAADGKHDLQGEVVIRPTPATTRQ